MRRPGGYLVRFPHGAVYSRQPSGRRTPLYFLYPVFNKKFRLSTIVHADKILLISNGEILESGTHKTLLQDGGYYSQLWNEQLKLNIAPDYPNADEHADEETKTT